MSFILRYLKVKGFKDNKNCEIVDQCDRLKKYFNG